ncbi:MAG: rhomboid family intramembrane serine protease [Saprospiraceae bacterium]
MSYFNFQQPFSGVVRHLIIINVLMFVGTYVVFGAENWDVVTGTGNLGRLQLAAFVPGSPHFQPYQVLTHMFMHGDIMHILFNMVSLYFFGSAVEMIWGHRRFLFFYLFCGVGAYICQMATQWWQIQNGRELAEIAYNIPMLGASGAVFGVYVAFACLFPNVEIRLLFPPIALKAKVFVPLIAALELFYGFGGYARGIAHFAHLGGALFGLILILIWYKGRLS